MFVAGPGQAQSTAPIATDQEEIVVTGSRIVRDGYEAPTPVSVLGAAELQAIAPGNISDALARLPALASNTRGQSSSGNVSGGTGGINSANLRNIGPSRTLVLLDGKRLAPTTLGGFGLNGGSADLNVIPNSLISRVDVVTGGASAVYGSDAIAGVVNFILDREYTGVKGSLQGGITTYGDGENYKVDLTAGTPFASGKGHFLITGEHAHSSPILYSDRAWVRDNAYGWLVNPAYGTGAGQSTSVPQYLAVDQMGMSNMTDGGLIVSGPLKGTMFLEGGAPATFRFGNVVSGLYMSGGDFQLSRRDKQAPLAAELGRQTAFSRVSYDLADNVNVYAELHYARAQQDSSGLYYWRFGNITVRDDNPFIPQSIKTRMTALGLTNFTLGTANEDFPYTGTHNVRTFKRYMVGADGSFDMADTAWDWTVSYSHGESQNSVRATNNFLVNRYNDATDAVTDPTTGRIVCRVALTNPNTNCVPINVMGIGVNPPGNGDSYYGYFMKNGYSYTHIGQSVLSASVSGDAFDLWAGPVSVALSGEYRRETADTIVSAEDQASLFYLANYKPTTGKYTVKEAALEVVVPIAREESWAKSLDINAAARATDYSVAGYVTTWKLGATYSPIDDLTFRATRSRDIRAPNIGDLFSGGRPGSGTIIDPFRNNQSYALITATVGNPALLPEKSDTTGLGVVFQPEFLPGFGASVDYYNINIKGALGALSGQAVVDQCFAGNQELCSFITRAAPGPGEQYGLMTFLANRSRNLLVQGTRGIDVEASYNVQLSDWVDDWDGNLVLRALANKVFKLRSSDVNGVVLDGAGVVGSVGTNAALTSPDLLYTFSASYILDRFTTTFTMRGMSSGVYNKYAVVCTTGCPVSTPYAPTVTYNHIAGMIHYGASFNYKVLDNAEMFFVVDNILNRDPQIRHSGNMYYQNEMGSGPTEGPTFDREGRAFRLGVRFSM